jgi:hypothetical protein
MSDSQPANSKADKIDGLLSICAFMAVLYAVFGLAEHHYVRAVSAGVLFLVVVPWLGRKLINRMGDRVVAVTVANIGISRIARFGCATSRQLASVN